MPVAMGLIGGFDQQHGFERGTPERIQQQIEICWEQAAASGEGESHEEAV